MTLHRICFNQIAKGTKTEEYREIKDYWTKRLAKEYDAIEFSNGYSSDCPKMLIKYHGCEIKKILHPITNKTEIVYALKLGKIHWIKNYGQTGKNREGESAKSNAI